MKPNVRIWTAAAAGPLAWFALLVASYALTPEAHKGGRGVVLVVLHAAALVIALVGGAIAWRVLRREQRVPSEEDITERARFIALFGVGLAVTSIALVIGSLLPVLLLGAGHEP